jgi:DNA-binding NtrC family response regulator
MTDKASALTNRISILAVSPSDEDHRSLRAILQHSNWTLNTAGTIQEALRFMEGNIVPVIVCARDLPDGSWEDLLDAFAPEAHPPNVVVTSDCADGSLWASVLNRGGYDVLLKPLVPEEVFALLSLAWRTWHGPNRAGASFASARTMAAAAW